MSAEPIPVSHRTSSSGSSLKNSMFGRLDTLVQLHVDQVNLLSETVTIDQCLAALCKKSGSSISVDSIRVDHPELVVQMEGALAHGVESQQYRTAARALIEALLQETEAGANPLSQSTLPKLKAPKSYRTPADNNDPLSTNGPNKAAVIAEVANYFREPLDRRRAALMLDAVLDSITKLLAEHGEVRIKGFGTFQARMRKGRDYKHPLSGQSISTPDKLKALFFPSDLLNDALREASGSPDEAPED